MPTKKPTGTRKQAVIRLNTELFKEIKIIAVRQEKSFNDLVIEALEGLLKKYESKR